MNWEFNRQRAAYNKNPAMIDSIIGAALLSKPLLLCKFYSEIGSYRTRRIYEGFRRFYTLYKPKHYLTLQTMDMKGEKRRVKNKW